MACKIFHWLAKIIHSNNPRWLAKNYVGVYVPKSRFSASHNRSNLKNFRRFAALLKIEFLLWIAIPRMFLRICFWYCVIFIFQCISMRVWYVWLWLIYEKKNEFFWSIVVNKSHFSVKNTLASFLISFNFLLRLDIIIIIIYLHCIIIVIFWLHSDFSRLILCRLCSLAEYLFDIFNVAFHSNWTFLYFDDF